MSPLIVPATLVAYFFVLLYVSHRAAQRGAQGNEAFFRAGRQSPWWMVALGMVGASISGVTFVSVPGWAASTGMTYLQMCMGFIVGYAVVAAVLLPLYYRLGLTSIYAWLGERFGPSTHRTGALFFVLSKLTGAAARLYLVCLVLGEFVTRPLLGDGLENKRAVEFYRGMLIGIGQLKDAGINVTVSAYNEPGPDHSIASLAAEIEQTKPDVVVGPLYPAHFTDIASISKRETKVAIPFSSKVPQVNYRPDLFLLNTPVTHEIQLASSLFLNTFKKDVTVVMLNRTDGNKQAFCTSLQKSLLDKGYTLLQFPASSSAATIAKALVDRGGRVVFVPNDASQPVLEALLAIQPEAVVSRFRLKDATLRGVALLEEACRGRGWLMPGGVPDTDRGAAVILDEFRGGKLGRLTLQSAPAKKAETSSALRAPSPEGKAE